jgi:hypothetical protein
MKMVDEFRTDQQNSRSGLSVQFVNVIDDDNNNDKFIQMSVCLYIYS